MDTVRALVAVTIGCQQRISTEDVVLTKAKPPQPPNHADPAAPVSIYTVAAAAGISYATVSRVFNNRAGVNPETRRRVLEAAARLGYVPNPIARGLSTKATAAIGIIVPGIADPFFMPIIQSIEEAARQLGLATLLRDTGRSTAAALASAHMLAQFHVSGVIILGGSEQRDEELAQQLKGTPTVVVLRQAKAAHFPAVYIDHAVGAQRATNHLVELGRRRIAFVGGDTDSVAALGRLAGYRAALAAAGLPESRLREEAGQFTLEGGAAATDRLLALPEDQRPDAIFYASDAMALAGLHRLHRAGLRVPGDIAIVGFGNIAFAAISEPPLTTVDVAREQMGALAVDLLQQCRVQPQQPPADIEVAPTLIVRSSTSDPR